MKKAIFLSMAGAVIVTCFLPLAASAAQFRGGETFILPQSEVIEDNLYAGGSDASIEGTINGDLLVAGGTVKVSGPVSGDVFVAGGQIDISGEIRGDLRVAGGQITLSGKVGGEVIMAGGDLRVTSSAVLGQDVVLAGGNIVMDGLVKGKLTVRGGTFSLGGQVEKDVSSSTQERVTLGEKATIGGKFDYSSFEEAKIDKMAKVVGIINYTKLPQEIGSTRPASNVWGVIIKLLMFVAAGLALYFISTKDTTNLTKETIDNPLRKFLIGLATLIILPIAAIIAFATVVGVPIGLFVLLLYGAFIVQGMVCAGIIFGAVLHKVIVKKELLDWRIVVGGILLLGLIRLVPYVGWVVAFVFFLMAFGAVVEMNARRFSNR